MEALGGNVASVNAGYKEGFSTMFARTSMDVIDNPDELIKLDYYKHKFPGKYDFSVTSKVFDGGSGVGAIADGRGDDDRLGTMELLAILSNITKVGGYSVHGGFTIEVPRAYMDYLGFDEIETEGFGQERLTVLAKREPKPELFGQGYELGRKLVQYNPETKEFCLRK